MYCKCLKKITHNMCRTRDMNMDIKIIIELYSLYFLDWILYIASFYLHIWDLYRYRSDGEAIT